MAHCTRYQDVAGEDEEPDVCLYRPCTRFTWFRRLLSRFPLHLQCSTELLTTDGQEKIFNFLAFTHCANPKLGTRACIIIPTTGNLNQIPRKKTGPGDEDLA